MAVDISDVGRALVPAVVLDARAPQRNVSPCSDSAQATRARDVGGIGPLTSNSGPPT